MPVRGLGSDTTLDSRAFSNGAYRDIGGRVWDNRNLQSSALSSMFLHVFKIYRSGFYFVFWKKNTFAVKMVSCFLYPCCILFMMKKRRNSGPLSDVNIQQ
jgi:hypothetical protein